uniref:Putative secreted protein n=1 Tax=Ixodes ricinus TaxID=34613 RepID=A0A6B0UBQ1_IXORI
MFSALFHARLVVLARVIRYGPSQRRRGSGTYLRTFGFAAKGPCCAVRWRFFCRGAVQCEPTRIRLGRIIRCGVVPSSNYQTFPPIKMYGRSPGFLNRIELNEKSN